MPKRAEKEQEVFLQEQRKKWAVCVNDERTYEAMIAHYCSLGLTGPLHVVPEFRHYVYKNYPHPRYSVPKAVVEYLASKRKSYGFDFFAFSKTSTEPWALYNEGKGLHTGMRQSLFDGTAYRGNSRFLSGKLTEMRKSG